MRLTAPSAPRSSSCRGPLINYTTRTSQSVRAIPEAAADFGGGDIGIAIGALGALAALVGVSLYNTERKARSDLESELVLMRSKTDDKDNEVKRAFMKLEEEKRAAAGAVSEAEVYKRRYGEAAKEIFKLERALEMKDGQLESFMLVSQRQIKYLEERYKELQQQSSGL